MSGIELVGLIASIASLILAVGAIWLSIVFFNMSNDASKATTEAAKGIDASVKRLENLFDKLYSDTFSMMRDTVSDMRKHIWNGEGTEVNENRNDILEEADKKAEEKVQEIKSALDKQLNEILKSQQIADSKVSGIGKELEMLLDKAIQTSRMIESEAREETVRNYILMVLRVYHSRYKKVVLARELVDSLKDNIPSHRIISELSNMKEEGLIYYDDEHLSPSTKVRMLNIKERTMKDDS